MRKYLFATLILIGVFGLTALQSNAQNIWGVRANVPFDFTVGDQLISAGMVSARGVNASSAGTLSITNHTNGENSRRIGHKLASSNAINDARLVFHRYGNRYYLAEVWVPGYKPWQIEKSASERAMERETHFAKNHRRQVVNIVAVMQ